MTKWTSFSDEVDDAIQDSILNLDQKLKGLLSEIEIKKELISPLHDASTIEHQKYLLSFSLEIKKALASMDAVVEIITKDANKNDAAKTVNLETC